MQETSDRMLQRIADLEAQNQILAAFSDAVVHNLKGLLYQIAGYTRTLRDVHSALPDARLRESLELTHNKALETLEIVDDLLFLSGADLEQTAIATGKYGQVSEPALEGMMQAEAIRGIDRPTEWELDAKGTQQADNEQDDARSYWAQVQLAGGGADRQQSDVPRNGDRPAPERRA